MKKSTVEAVSADGRVLMRFKHRDLYSKKGQEPRKFWCHVCKGWRKPSRDHFWPRALGGTVFFPASSNVWVVCRHCNSSKGHKMPDALTTLAFSIAKGFCKL